MFHERGFYNTSLSDIVTSAGLDRSTAYYYVSSKEDLYLEVVQEELVALARTATAVAERSSAAAERLRDLIVLLMSSFEEHYPDLYLATLPGINSLLTDANGRAEEVALRMASVAKARRQVFEAFRSVVAGGLRAGEFDSPLSPSILSDCLIQMVASSQGWYRPDGALSGSEIGGFLADFALGGLVKKEGRRTNRQHVRRSSPT
jgi:AcrR family transcriptional regulator